MTLYRFIGKKELEALMNNETVFNYTDYSEEHDTNSIGFCFFADNRKNTTAEAAAERAHEYLGGIVDHYALVQIEVEKARKAWGWYSAGRKIEYNLTEYSKANVVSAWICKNKVIDYFGKNVALYRGLGEKVI